MTSSLKSTETAIDHIGVVGPDIARLRDLYTRLGFTVTKPVPVMQPAPDGEGDVPLGQVSARVVLADSYLELTAVRHVGQGSPLDPWLQRHPGLHVLALKSEDAAKSAKELIAAGLVMPPMRSASYRLHGSEGEGTVRYRWVELPQSIAREGFGCVVEHMTPELVFNPAFARHANGARRLRSVFAIVDDMDEAFARYHRLPGTRQKSFVVGRSILMRDQQFIVVEPKGFAALFAGAPAPPPPCLGGFSLSVGDIGETRAVLEAAGVPYRPWGDTGLWVMPDAAGGAVVVFAEEAGS